MTGAAPRHILMTADAVGGVWQYACDLAAALAAEGVAVTLAVLGPGPLPVAPDLIRGPAAFPTQEEAGPRIKPGVTVVETGLPLDWLADSAEDIHRAAAAIRDLAVAVGADLVHLNSPSLACVRYPMPVLAVAHGCAGTWWDAVETGPLPEQFHALVALIGEGLRAADAVAAPSTAYARAVATRYGVQPVVIPNGRTLPGPTGTTLAPYAFTAGRLWDRAKDMALLDRAAARLDVPVLAAGPMEGPQGERILFHHLCPLGTLPAAAMREALAARPIFVSPARFEPFGLAVLEAAAAGCPLVLSDIATFRELWEGAACFVAPGDETALADAIAELVFDPDRRRALGDAAAERARRYTVATMTAGTLDLYRSLATLPHEVAA
jgi:glycosyltransferase involved in cell wall biosynthesis